MGTAISPLPTRPTPTSLHGLGAPGGQGLVRKAPAWAHLSRAGQGSWKGRCCGHSPGRPLIPIGPRLPGSPLGPEGPGSPRAPTRSGGESSSAPQLQPCAWPAPGPARPASTYHLGGAEGPSHFLWFLVALGWRGRQGSVVSRVPTPAPPAAGPPRTPVLRGPWRPSPQAQGKTRKTEAHKGVKLGVSSREGAGSN